MKDIEWLLMAAERAKELPEPFSWTYVRWDGDKVMFTRPASPIHVGDADGLRPFKLTAEDAQAVQDGKMFHTVSSGW